MLFNNKLPYPINVNIKLVNDEFRWKISYQTPPNTPCALSSIAGAGRFITEHEIKRILIGLQSQLHEFIPHSMRANVTLTVTNRYDKVIDTYKWDNATCEQAVQQLSQLDKKIIRLASNTRHAKSCSIQ